MSVYFACLPHRSHLGIFGFLLGHRSHLCFGEIDVKLSRQNSHIVIPNLAGIIMKLASCNLHTSHLVMSLNIGRGTIKADAAKPSSVNSSIHFLQTLRGISSSFLSSTTILKSSTRFFYLTKLTKYLLD